MDSQALVFSAEAARNFLFFRMQEVRMERNAAAVRKFPDTYSGIATETLLAAYDAAPKRIARAIAGLSPEELSRLVFRESGRSGRSSRTSRTRRSAALSESG